VGAAGLVGVMLNEQPYMARATKHASEARPSTPSNSDTAPAGKSKAMISKKQSLVKSNDKLR
jgi:hypothetical protein